MSVISPWLFYVIDLLDKLREVAIIVFWIIVVTILITGFVALLEGEYWEDKIIQKLKKGFKIIGHTNSYFICNVCCNSIKRYDVQNVSF